MSTWTVYEVGFTVPHQCDLPDKAWRDRKIIRQVEAGVYAECGACGKVWYLDYPPDEYWSVPEPQWYYLAWWQLRRCKVWKKLKEGAV